MDTQYITALYAYNAWANERIVDTAAHLDAEQFVQSGIASFGSVRDTLVHTMSAQWIWLSRWQGQSPRALHDPSKFGDVAAIRTAWTDIEQDTAQFVATLDAAQLDRGIEYTNTSGQPQRVLPLWQLMVHQVNHATQHRSEIAGMLTQFGHSPGELDFIRYLQR